MGISLTLSAYIVITFMLYYKDRSLMKNAMRYIEKSVPVSKGLVAVAFLFEAAFCRWLAFSALGRLFFCQNGLTD